APALKPSPRLGRKVINVYSRECPMIIKVAGFVLVGSVAALAGLGIADLAGYDLLESRHFGRHMSADRRDYVKHFEYRGRRHERQDRRRVEVERVVAAAEEAVAPADVLGTYQFKAKGDLLDKLEWNSTVELDLQADGRYRLRVVTNADNKMEEETSWGHYRVRGDRLVLISAHNDDRHTFTIDGDRLQFDASWKEKIALRAVGVEDAYMTKVQQ
ncbi:MAG: hypothetical protein WEE89_21580, partial [Gemmatimonadota bacterium]